MCCAKCVHSHTNILRHQQFYRCSTCSGTSIVEPMNMENFLYNTTFNAFGTLFFFPFIGSHLVPYVRLLVIPANSLSLIKIADSHAFIQQFVLLLCAPDLCAVEWVTVEKRITNQLHKIHYACVVLTLNTNKHPGSMYPLIVIINVCKYEARKCIESIFFSTSNQHANTLFDIIFFYFTLFATILIYISFSFSRAENHSRHSLHSSFDCGWQENGIHFSRMFHCRLMTNARLSGNFFALW